MNILFLSISAVCEGGTVYVCYTDGQPTPLLSSLLPPGFSERSLFTNQSTSQPSYPSSVHTHGPHTHTCTAHTFPSTDAPPAASLPPPPNSHSLAGLGVSLQAVKVKHAAKSMVLSMQRLLVGSSLRPCGPLAPGWKKDRMGPPQKQMSLPLRGCAV